MTARYLHLALSVLVAAACVHKPEQSEPEGVEVTIHACQEGSGDTRTTLQDGGTQVYWEQSDKVNVFFYGTGSCFVSQNTSLATAADFTGTLNIFTGMTEGDDSSNLLWGLYPYRTDATSDGASVTTTLPSTQTGRAGSFAKNTHIALACSYSHNLAFYNVTGGLRFSLTQDGIKSVTLKGNNNESLAGTIKLAFENGEPKVKKVTGGESIITLTAPAGGTFQTGQWYYFETIPCTLSDGFIMTFHKDGEVAEFVYNPPVNILRGRYCSIADVDAGLEFETDELSGGIDVEFIKKKSNYWFYEADGDGDDTPATVRFGTKIPDHYGDGIGADDDVTDFTKKLDNDWIGNKVQVKVNGKVDSNAKYRYEFSEEQPVVNGKRFVKKNATTLTWNNQEVIKLRNQSNGEIQFLCNPTTKQLINWASNPADEEPNARLLYCNVDLVAYYPADGQDAGNDSTTDLGKTAIHVRFIRPVDINITVSGNLVDGAPGLGSTIEIGKFISAKDWQGYDIFYYDTATEQYVACLWPEDATPYTAWVHWYGYYGFSKLTIDLGHVKTNQEDGVFRRLGEVNPSANVSVIYTKTGQREYASSDPCTIDIAVLTELSNYLFSYKNSMMGSGADFQLQVPIAIEYAWGTYSNEIIIDVLGKTH